MTTPLKLDDDGWPRMEWFGESWGAPVCEPDLHGETPVGSLCLECEKPIGEHDQGFRVPHISMSGPPWHAFHQLCFMRSVLGPNYPDVTTDS